MARLRIPIEFNQSKVEDLELYSKLLKYSNPAAYIKDVLRGLLPIPDDIQVINTNSKSTKYEEENDDEDLMDI